jgi:hypothetical protein
MPPTKPQQILFILAHAVIGWGLCGAVMGIGIAVTTLGNALIIHAIAAPVIFAIISVIYFKKFNYTSPLKTALIFVSVVILIDFFLVALVINKSMAMFKSLIGTWIPFLLIFAVTYLTGLLINYHNKKGVA